MRTLISSLLLLLFVFSCEKDTGYHGSFMKAKISDFDPSCSTCILQFPDDSLLVKYEIGRSPGNSYRAINLNRGDYQPGQLVKVRIRKPENSELNLCTTLYPSDNHQPVYVTDVRDYDDLRLNDTISLSLNDCLNYPEGGFFICFDSLIGDSRCPAGVYCFWEGNAEVRFRFEKYNSNPILFDLNTHHGFTTDTIIDNYKIKLLDLKPHPVYSKILEKDRLRAEIIIEKTKE